MDGWMIERLERKKEKKNDVKDNSTFSKLEFSNGPTYTEYIPCLKRYNEMGWISDPTRRRKFEVSKIICPIRYFLDCTMDVEH